MDLIFFFFMLESYINLDFIYIRGFTNESDFNETRFPDFFFIKNT